MRETGARVLAAALMTGAIAAVVAMSALFEAPREEATPLTMPPSSQQRTVRVAALPEPTRPVSGERRASVPAATAARSAALVSVLRGTRPTPAGTLAPRSASPRTPRPPTAPAPQPQPQPQPQPEPQPQPQPLASSPPTASATPPTAAPAPTPSHKEKKAKKPKQTQAPAPAPTAPVAAPAPAVPAAPPEEENDKDHSNDSGGGNGNANGHEKDHGGPKK